MAPPMTGLSDAQRFLRAASAGLLFSLACLGAALQPGKFECRRVAEALDCPTRL